MSMQLLKAAVSISAAEMSQDRGGVVVDHAIERLCREMGHEIVKQFRSGVRLQCNPQGNPSVPAGFRAEQFVWPHRLHHEFRLEVGVITKEHYEELKSAASALASVKSQLVSAQLEVNRLKKLENELNALKNALKTVQNVVNTTDTEDF